VKDCLHNVHRTIGKTDHGYNDQFDVQELEINNENYNNPRVVVRVFKFKFVGNHERVTFFRVGQQV
jgi:hypothetical protein